MRIDKSIRNELFYQDINQRLVYIHLLLSVNSTQGITPKGGKIDAGQTVIGYDYLAKDVGITTSKTRTALSKLQNQGIITLESVVRVGTVVTILNFEQEEVKPKAKKKAPIKTLKSIEERKIDFKRECFKYYEKYKKDDTFFGEFVAHWTAYNKGDKKMKFEKQKDFYYGSRLSRWYKNYTTNFGKDEPKISKADDHLLNHVNKFI